MIAIRHIMLTSYDDNNSSIAPNHSHPQTTREAAASDILHSIYTDRRLSDFMKISFGTKNPKGLTLTYEADTNVKIRPYLFEKDSYYNALKIFPFKGYSGFLLLFGIITLQSFAAVKAFTASYIALNMLYKFLISPHNLKISSLDKPRLRVNAFHLLGTQLQTGNKTLPSYLTRLTGYLLQTQATDLDISAPLYDVFDQKQAQKRGLGKLINQGEITTLLHCIVSHNYRQCGQLPVTQNELFQCLYDQGLHIPDRLLTQKSTHIKTIHDECGAITTFNEILQNFRSPDHAMIFYQDVLPKFYGRLLELYGDQDGSCRMGTHDHNTLLRFKFYEYAQQHWNAVAITPRFQAAKERKEAAIIKSENRMIHTIQAMSQKDALWLFLHLIQSGWQNTEQSPQTHRIAVNTLCQRLTR